MILGYSELLLENRAFSEDEELEEGYYSEGVIADLEKIVKTKSAGQIKFKDGKKTKNIRLLKLILLD